jgi:hypothetical protein
LEEEAEGGEEGLVGVYKEVVEGGGLEIGYGFASGGEVMLGGDGAGTVGIAGPEETGSGEPVFGGIAQEDGDEIVATIDELEGGDFTKSKWRNW